MVLDGFQAGQASRDRTASDGKERPAEPRPPHDEGAGEREDDDEPEHDRDRADLGGEHLPHEVIGDPDADRAFTQQVIHPSDGAGHDQGGEEPVHPEVGRR